MNSGHPYYNDCVDDEQEYCSLIDCDGLSVVTDSKGYNYCLRHCRSFSVCRVCGCYFPGIDAGCICKFCIATAQEEAESTAEHHNELPF